MSHRKHVDECLNCGATTPGAFCPACGQEAVDAAVTFRDQMADFFSEVLSVEARLPQTVKQLLFHPGALTRAYNGGQRVRFVTPLKTYLFASVAFFLVLSFAASRGEPQVVHETGASSGGFGLSYSPPGSSIVHVDVGGDKATAGDGANDFRTADEFDRWLARPGNDKQLPAFLVPHIRSLLKSPSGFVGALVDMVSKASMVLVPIHALVLRLLYWRPRRLYGEHIVFSLHVHSFAYVVQTAAALVGLAASARVGSAVTWLTFAVSVVYVVAAARTAYAEGLVRSALKMVVAGTAYGVALLGVLLLTAGAVFFMN